MTNPEPTAPTAEQLEAAKGMVANMDPAALSAMLQSEEAQAMLPDEVKSALANMDPTELQSMMGSVSGADLASATEESPTED